MSTPINYWLFGFLLLIIWIIGWFIDEIIIYKVDTTFGPLLTGNAITVWNVTKMMCNKWIFVGILGLLVYWFMVTQKKEYETAYY